MSGEKASNTASLVLPDLEQTKGYELNLVVIVNCHDGVLPPSDEIEACFARAIEITRTQCGRYVLREPASEIANLFKIGKPLRNFGARDNIAPTQDAPIVRVGNDGQRELAMLRWGLIPSWADDAKIGYKMINARAESVAERPAVRAAFKHRRWLVPATGYFE